MLPIITTDFSDYGPNRESVASGLLDAWRRNGLHADFRTDKWYTRVDVNGERIYLTAADFKKAMQNYATSLFGVNKNV